MHFKGAHVQRQKFQLIDINKTYFIILQKYIQATKSITTFMILLLNIPKIFNLISNFINDKCN